MWKAKESALKKTCGSFKESFRFIPSLCSTILKYNPGSIVQYEVENDGSFKGFFVAYSASIQGFLNGVLDEDIASGAVDSGIVVSFILHFASGVMDGGILL
ncbi:hypothetical protein AAC387_Pa08g1324 [Persea americana]